MNTTYSTKLVIFDMDGLMFDTERIGIRAWMKAGRDFDAAVTEEMVIETIGLDIDGTGRVFKKYLGEHIPFDEMKRKRFSYAYEEIEHNGIPVKEGLLDLLDWLKTTPIKTAVATSTERDRATRFLTWGGVLDRFDTIVCGNEIPRGKPEPDIFLEAARRLNCSPANCIVLEDSENGLKAASRAGMRPVLIVDIKRPSPEVERLIHTELSSLSEVRALLSSL